MKSTYKFLVAILLPLVIVACSNPKEENNVPVAIDFNAEKVAIGALLDSLNTASGRADYNTYFSYYADSAVFMGTDATENWNKPEFMVWAKPFFDRGNAWSFSVLERNIYFDEGGSIAWFDELLDTQMKICRGSGVVRKIGSDWKIEQYVLSMTIPNEQVDSIVAIKAPLEDVLIGDIKKR